MNALSARFSTMADRRGARGIAKRQRMSLREVITGLLVTSAVAAGICYGEYYWTVGRHLEMAGEMYAPFCSSPGSCQQSVQAY